MDVQRHRVVVSQSVSLPRATVPVLLSTIESLFSGKDKPVRLLYQKGEDLQVEYLRLRDSESGGPELNLDSGLLTPYQVVRQYCDVSVVAEDDFGEDKLRYFCALIAQFRKRCPFVTGLVLRRSDDLLEWAGADLPASFGIPVYEDPDAPNNMVFLCGSTKGSLLVEFELAIAVSMGA